MLNRCRYHAFLMTARCSLGMQLPHSTLIQPFPASLLTHHSYGVPAVSIVLADVCFLAHFDRMLAGKNVGRAQNARS